MFIVTRAERQGRAGRDCYKHPPPMGAQSLWDKNPNTISGQRESALEPAESHQSNRPFRTASIPEGVERSRRRSESRPSSGGRHGDRTTTQGDRPFRTASVPARNPIKAPALFCRHLIYDGAGWRHSNKVRGREARRGLFPSRAERAALQALSLGLSGRRRRRRAASGKIPRLFRHPLATHYTSVRCPFSNAASQW
jgi:hypothetical protein